MEGNYFQGPGLCHRYQAKLKSRARKLSKEFWVASKRLFEENKTPDLSFTSLVLDTQDKGSASKIKKLKRKKSKMSRPKKLRTYIPEDKPEISASGLLKKDKDVLLVGKPGIGKTALTREMLRLWAERDDNELDYMFYFDMRDTAHFTPTMSLEDLLFSVYSEPDEGRDEVLQDIKRNSENVTLIFDGLTDLSPSVVQNLAEKNLLPDSKIIITCRPDDEDDFFFDEPLRVEVKGFSEQTIKTYLSATLGEDHQKVLSRVELLTLCHVPMYALMVAACFSSEDSPQTTTTTEIYINIVRFCLQMNSNRTQNRNLNPFIRSKGKEILSLAEGAFIATQRKTVNLPEVQCEDRCVLSFLKPLVVKVALTESVTKHAFLHYTMQEFFAALWLLKNPDEIRNVFQQSLTEEMKHMKPLIPLMCRLLNQKSPSLMSCLIPAEELNSTCEWFFKEMMATFLPVADTEDSGPDVPLVFLCQCLYESQRPEACIYLLDKLDYSVDLSGENLDPYSCCAVAFVVTQSKERKIRLNVADVTVSELGMRRLLGCLQNVQWCDLLPQQLWKIFLLSEEQMDYETLLGLDGNQLHLPVCGKRQLFERAVKVMQRMSPKVNVCLYWNRAAPVCQSLCESLLEAMPFISSLSFKMTERGPEKCPETLEREQKGLFQNLCLKAALHNEQSSHNVLKMLLSLFPVKMDFENILLDLYQRIKSEGFSSILPSLQSVFQSAPAVWSINLSERKTSILLEVLKLQSEKKQVMLTGCSHEESEVRSFLQCLPYISQLSVVPQLYEPLEEIRFLRNLFCAAAEREQQTGEKMLELLSSVCRYKAFPLTEIWCDFLLDLYSFESKTGLSVLPSLQSVFQSAPAVWSINLSERKTSILLEVLKLQSEKKQVELTGCSHEESEVRSFLQCLPYISQLSLETETSEKIKFLAYLLCAAEKQDQQTGEKILELLLSVCRYKAFPLKWKWCDFLLDLYSFESKTGLSVLPSLQSVFQSAPAVWSINLSERKTSILLEVLKLQSEKKHVRLTGCSHEESEVRSFLQCLPYISQLSFVAGLSETEETRFFGNLLCAAAEREQQTGEKMLKLLSSVCRYQTFLLEQKWSDFLLDLYCCESETDLSVLPSLQSVFQSAPAVLFINLSVRKTSILLEVLKLQSEKKQVELTGCSHEESEVRSFLQCLPYISQLSVDHLSLDLQEQTRFFGNLLCAAAEREQQTGEKILELLSSVCRYQTFPLDNKNIDDNYEEYKSDFLLDLCSHVKDCESKTGLSVLPSLQSVFQSAPAVWSINLSERKTSILLEVLKLQSEKKQVELTGCSHEESEVRSFLQCLPYISQLSFVPRRVDHYEETHFFVDVFCAAAEREQQMGENILEQLASVCSYEPFPFINIDHRYHSDLLLDLYSLVMDCESKTGLSVLPSLQSVFQSAPAVWSINLSERKTSILLEVLKLQSEKKQVKLTGCSHEESEVRSFLQCLPYISQLSLDPQSSDLQEQTRFFMNLFCAAAEREQQTGEKMLELLSSVCRYQTFPSEDLQDEDQSDFLLDIYFHLKHYESKTGLSVLPSLQSVFQSAPAVWFINLSERKTSILLEVLKLQSEKKHVRLTYSSQEESEVRSFLQCLPYISQLSLDLWLSDVHEQTRFLGTMFCAAADREKHIGEKTLEMLSSVCRYELLIFDHDDDKEGLCDSLLDLCSHVKDCESKTGLSVLPSLQSVFQSAPAVWSIDLSERKTSILLEVLKLQSEKKQVKLTGCSHEESEVRSFLQCLPYISQLSLYLWSSDLQEETRFFGNLFCAAAEREQQTGEKMLELLSSVCSKEIFSFENRPIFNKHRSDFLLDLCSHVKDCESKTGLSVLPSLQSVFQSAPAVWSINLSERKTSILLEVLKLQSEKKQVELTGCSHEESEVRSFLQCLPYISQLRLNEKILQQLLSLLHEVQDEDLTLSFLSKLGGDLSSCCLNWELLHHLLQQSSAQIIAVNLRKNRFLQHRAAPLLPFLDRILFKRPSPSFVRTFIRELCSAHASHMVPSLLRSLDHVINLSCTELDSVDCAALLFILRHSDRVQLKLLWASIPAEETKSILFTLDRVSDLSVDRKQLLRFIHCCAASGGQQEAASHLLRTLQHSLDLSCSSCVELSEEAQTEPLSLSAGDCRAVSTILRHSSRDTQLHLRDCEVEDSGLDLLFPVLDRVCLRVSKTVLLQLLSLLPVNSERDTVRRAEFLGRALGGELDLSHTTLDQRLCGALLRMLDFCEDLTELDLSHCQLTDQLLLQLITHLHKVCVLDLSHNKITDASTDGLLQLLSINPSISTVRLFSNSIVDRTPFKKNKQFEIW
ncbi:uncharacterized protein [Leuresthes tenuis]|uniref:uncharacterized protein isoform X2 n=1 Tax=Leuresthes tenuis TaxID=355514 RepID=UPI003B504948